MSNPIPGTDLTSGANYYNRFEAEEAKGYDEHLLISGNVAQTAEINEIQSRFKARIKALGDHLLRDGDIKTGGDLVIQDGSAAGYKSVTAQAAEIWLDGAERRVAEKALQIPSAGTVLIGVYLRKSVVDETADPSLRDPAIGLRLVGEAGAARLKVEAAWGYDSDGQAGDFWAVHRLVNGVLQARSETPESNAVATAISRYDRQSTGGSYVVDGFRVTAIPGNTEASQVYSVAAGTARVAGAEIITVGAQTLEIVGAPDTESIASETHIASGEASQVLAVAHAPVAALTSVLIEKLVTDMPVLRSQSNATTDTFTNKDTNVTYTSTTTVEYVKQGGTTFVAYTNGSTPYDYRKIGDTLVWNTGVTPAPVNTIPSPGSTYTVKFQYQKNVTSTSTITDSGRTITLPAETPVADTEIDIQYDYNLPRIDRVCLANDGSLVYIRGIPARFGSVPAAPYIPDSLLGLASVYQTWIAGSRRVQNDGHRVVSMAQLEGHSRDIQTLFELVSANALANDLAAYNARENLGRRGLFVDPFLNDNARDAGADQTAQIAGGTLTLGVQVESSNVRLPGIIGLNPSGVVHRVTQNLSSDSMQINPYLVFSAPRSYAYLSPWFDFWPETTESVLPPKYENVYQYRTVTSTWQSDTTTSLLNEEKSDQVTTKTEKARFMRETAVQFTLLNWGSNENLIKVKIDGREVSFAERIP